jgi:hypothetical protein
MANDPDGMVCAVCAQPLTRRDHRFADCWMDPAGIACVAHRACLRRLGDHELDLPPVA